MSLTLLATAGLSAALAGAIGAPLRALARRDYRSTPQPPTSDGPDGPAYRGLPPAAFTHMHRQGGFGEALTFVMMAADGWRPINGKPGKGPQGIDGIFWQRTHEGWQARLIETKTNTSGYKPHAMSHEKLLGNLDDLYVSADETLGALYAHIAAGLRSGSPAVTTELWRHDLRRGVTTVFQLDAGGTPTGQSHSRKSVAHMEALAEGVREMDPSGSILTP